MCRRKLTCQREQTGVTYRAERIEGGPTGARRWGGVSVNDNTMQLDTEYLLLLRWWFFEFPLSVFQSGSEDTAKTKGGEGRGHHRYFVCVPHRAP